MRKESVYALYKGDKFLDIGTNRQLAKKYGWKMTFVTFLSSPANIRRDKGKRLLTIKIGTTADDIE